MEKKKEYTAPQITTISFRSEVGYAGSALSQMFFWDAFDSKQVEDYTQHNTWNDGTSFWE